MNSLNEVFFRPNSPTSKPYEEILKEVQEYCTSHYATAISADDSEEAKKMLRQYIQQYVQERRYAVEDLSAEQLSDKLYEDMAGYSILRKWIYMDGIEEVNVNARCV